jgi:hypothetical protein
METDTSLPGPSRRRAKIDMKTVTYTVRGSAGDLVAGDRTGGKTAGATRSDLDGVVKGARATAAPAVKAAGLPIG